MQRGDDSSGTKEKLNIYSRSLKNNLSPWLIFAAIQKV